MPKLAIVLRRELEAEGWLDHEGSSALCGAMTLQLVKSGWRAARSPKTSAPAAMRTCWAASSGLATIPAGRSLGGDLATGQQRGVEAKLLEPGAAACPSSSRAQGSHIALLLGKGMPPPQRELLLWLLDFLVECAARESSSRMGVEQLAVARARDRVYRMRGAASAANGRHEGGGGAHAPPPKASSRQTRGSAGGAARSPSAAARRSSPRGRAHDERAPPPALGLC